MAQTLNSLLQWIPSAFETPDTSSRCMCRTSKFKHNNITDISHNYRIVETFEELVSQYVRQIHQNEPPQVFNYTSLTMVAERVSSLMVIIM